MTISSTSGFREIPFNYTSADDARVVSLLLGGEAWERLQELRSRRVTGRSARLLMRVLGEVFIHQRNAYLFEELVASPRRKKRLFANLAADLADIEEKAQGEPLVHEILVGARDLLDRFAREVDETPSLRDRTRRELGAVIGEANVLFDPFTRVAHATDATDWRLYLPFAVVRPTEERLFAPLLAAIERLGLAAIPRGAGTGLTGGAVPLRPRCVVVNCEALNRIGGIDRREFRSGDGVLQGTVMTLEAGVVTERAMEVADEHGLVFATDPTSAWACTIGGNIAENAGGKTAVLWGTCIDNLLAWKTAMPGGSTWTARREGHPFRKILPGDDLRFTVTDSDGRVVRNVSISGAEIRKPGLWKDITNKVLGGLPGLQKEGTDGIITSAEFILHPRYAATTTLCVEFFGSNFDEASRVILELDRAFPNRGEEVLQALEHFDDEYVRAIGYRTKAARAEAPKAVILIDVVGPLLSKNGFRSKGDLGICVECRSKCPPTGRGNLDRVCCRTKRRASRWYVPAAYSVNSSARFPGETSVPWSPVIGPSGTRKGSPAGPSSSRCSSRSWLGPTPCVRSATGWPAAWESWSIWA